MENKPTQSPIPTSHNSSETFILIVRAIALMTISGVGGYFLGVKQNQTRNQQTTSISPDIIQPGEPVLCIGSKLGITIQVPDNWICYPGDYSLELRSELFTVHISNLGRGPVCGSPSPACGNTEFYSDDQVSMELWTINNQNAEIFGTFKKALAGLTWILIKYKDMGTRNLTASEKSELITVINAVKFTP